MPAHPSGLGISSPAPHAIRCASDCLSRTAKTSEATAKTSEASEITFSGLISGKTCPDNVRFAGTLRHRYRDSNPGFRTENPIREGSLGRFGGIWASLDRWSAVELVGVG